MGTPEIPYRKIILRTLVAALCSVLVGLIRYGTAVLDQHDHRFAFVVFGACGALFFFSMLLLGQRNALGVLLVLFMINSGLLTGNLLTDRVFADLLFFALFMTGIFIFSKLVYRRKLYHPLINAAILGALTSLGTIVASYVWIALRGGIADASPLNVISANFVEFFIGLGIGIGISVTEMPEVKGRLGI